MSGVGETDDVDVPGILDVDVLDDQCGCGQLATFRGRRCAAVEDISQRPLPGSQAAPMDARGYEAVMLPIGLPPGGAGPKRKPMSGAVRDGSSDEGGRVAIRL